jgi:hypothetical protein
VARAAVAVVAHSWAWALLAATAVTTAVVVVAALPVVAQALPVARVVMGALATPF